MSASHLKQALEKCAPEIVEPILAFLSGHASRLDASDQEVEQLGYALSQISGGSGLDLITLYLLPKTGCKRQSKRLIERIQWRLDRYEPEKEYPLHLVIFL